MPAASVIPLGLALLAAAYVAASSRFGHASREMPQLIGAGMIVLCALDLLSRSGSAWGVRVARWLNPAGLSDAQGGHARRRQILAACGIAALAAGMMLAGVLPAVACFALAAFRVGGLSWPRSALTAAAVTVMIWVLFSLMLGLKPYPGLLFGGEL